MKFVLLVIAVIIAMVAAAPLSEDQYQFLFSRFVQQYNKQYETNDFFSRFNTFKSNLNKIVAHNAAGESFKMAVNKFADLSEVEFMSFMGFKPVLSKQQQQAQPCPMFNSQAKATPVDWRTKSVLNAIKDQGSCGSCWAFSTMQSLEAANAIATGKLYDLAEQQLVDCSGSTGNEGCNGGLMNSAFDYLISAGGACLTKDYAYTARDGSCKKCTPMVQVASYDMAGSGEEGLAATLQNGPVAVALAATSDFQFYSSGLFSKCSSTSLNHGVGLVALVEKESQFNVPSEAWVIRNSWGADWGAAGHIYLDFSKANCLGMSVTAAKWNVIPKVKA